MDKNTENTTNKKTKFNNFKVIAAYILESFLIMLVTIMDNIQVSKIDKFSVQILSICRQPILLFVSVLNALNVVSIMLINKYLKKSNKNATDMFNSCLKITFIVTLFISVIYLIFSYQICKIMNAKEKLLDSSFKYLRIYAFCFVFNGLLNTLNVGLKCKNKITFSILSYVFLNVLNVVLNYVFIKKYKVNGAALATILSFIITLFISFFINKILKDCLKIKIKSEFIKCVKVFYKPFIYVLLEVLCVRFGYIIYSRIINSLSNDSIYINGICSDVNSFLYAFSEGFSLGILSVLSISKENKKNVFLKFSDNHNKSVVVFIFVCILILLFSNSIIQMYHVDDTQLIGIIKNVYLIIIISCIFQNSNMIFLSYLRNNKELKFALITSILFTSIIRPLLALLFIKVDIFIYPILSVTFALLCEQFAKYVTINLKIKKSSIILQ